jgi:3'-phosphoadenosine 5'-phosphosulfate sulfotransferase (PAPS reductase)/FAD synthetase
MQDAQCERGLVGLKVYLSHGGGVNSWALYLWLMEQGEKPGVDFEAVFVDHGTDWPETYEYMDMMIKRGYPVTVINPDYRGCSNIYEYCKKYSLFPSRQPGHRWCTQCFKVDTLKAYCKTPYIELIGFDADEAHRLTGRNIKDDIDTQFPLIDSGIGRQDCIKIIQRHGLPIPPKSGCYICPFQGRDQWVLLRAKHPELFCRAKRLEELCNERRAAKGKEPVYFRDIPLEALIQVKDGAGRRAIEGQTEMFDDHDRPPCRCGL